jgi:hypothetical protein
MKYSGCGLALAMAMFFLVPGSGFGADRPQGMVTKEELALRGSWYSTEGSLTFRNNGTIKYKGRTYYYAVSNGGLIQLTGRRSSNALPYRLVGGKLILTEQGKSTIYTRTRDGN